MQFKDFFNSASYVTASEEYYFPYIRKNFCLQGEVKSAKLYVSALGFCELYCNGEKVTDDLYVTPYYHYNQQDIQDNCVVYANDEYYTDELSSTIGVSVFDITAFLRKGSNAFGLILAGGWYRTDTDKHGGFRNFGKTKACFRIVAELENGETVETVSDGECKWTESFLLRAGIFHEEHDERKELVGFSEPDYDDGEWKSVRLVPPPEAKYIENDCPPNRVIRWVKPVLVKETETEKVYDMGEILTGVPVLVGGSAGDTISCLYSEVLDEDKSVNVFHAYDQNSVFISDGRREHYIRFTWHGFRYIRITTTGAISDLSCEKCAVIYADIKNTSTFVCDNEIVNYIYNAYVSSQQMNYQCGVPTDCPQIERKGYTGDGQLLCDLGMMLFDSKKLYRKWINDIADVQDKKTGFVHYTAPCFIGCGGGPGGWSCAIVHVPYVYYKAYGEKDILKTYYPNMRKYLEFMDSESNEDGLIQISKRKNLWCLGDWSSPKGRDSHLPTPFTNSCMYIYTLKEMIEIAKICGFEKDIPAYERRMTELRQGIDLVYYDAVTSDYCKGDQGANAFALLAGLGDERTLKNLDARYRELGGFDTGIFATKYLPRVLFEKGYADTAMGLYVSQNPVSFYTWMQDGANTLYESWKNARSLNHPMFGSVVEYLFTYLLGIRQNGGCAYKKVIVNPVKTSLVHKASGSLETAAGKFEVAFERTEKETKFTVVVPENTECEFLYEGVKKTLCGGKNEIVVHG